MKTGFTLDSGEQVVRKVNRHWIDLLPVAVSTTLLIVILLVMGYAFGRYRDTVSYIPASLVVLVGFVLLALATAIFVVGVWVYKQNYLLLTNMHLIQVQQIGLFNRQISQLSLARVQDVSGRRVGLLATMLDFGNVEVQSASEQEKFIFRNAPAPQELADQCLQAHENYVRQGGEAATETASDTAAGVE